LVSTIIKETSTSEDEDFVKSLLLKLIESICYHYLLKRLLVKTARLIRIIITETRGSVKENASHTVFVNLKKKEKKD